MCIRLSFTVACLCAAIALPAFRSPAGDTPKGNATSSPKQEELDALKACASAVAAGLRPIASDRAVRFQGKVSEANALCRGGQKAEQFRNTPWVDWANYWGTGDLASLPKGFVSARGPAFRGVTGALLDLEFQRVELIKFNLFDNNGTYEQFRPVGAGSRQVLRH